MADKKFTIKITDNETNKTDEYNTNSYIFTAHIDGEQIINSIGADAPISEVFPCLLSLKDIENQIIADFDNNTKKQYAAVCFARYLNQILEIEGDETDDEQAISPKNLC